MPRRLLMIACLCVMAGLVLLAQVGCTSPTAPSCRRVTLPAVKESRALWVEGRLVLLMIAAPKVTTEQCGDAP